MKHQWLLTAILAGLFVAGPFLTTRALGTKEAYNYSLSVADAVTQFRAGHIPMLAGQSEYAFNGRIHPLRTAPALAYLTSLLDFVTFRQLGFWTLQNLVLALSLVGGAATCFRCLRQVTPATPATAALLAALYVFCPAVLAAAYGMDLYMTVLTVPLVPLIIAANVSAFTDRQRTHSLQLGVALAACWLAHPPVALWMSLTTACLQVAALMLCRPDGRGLARSGAGVAALVVLAGYGFISALTASPYGDIVHQHDTSLLLREVQRVFPDSFRPVSARADQLGDFQAGYAVWGLAAAGLGVALFRRAGTALALLAGAAFLLLFTLPVPGIHPWLWAKVPTVVLNLTNQWPMQRLYLPFTALVLFAFALVWRRPEGGGRFTQDAMRMVLLAAVGWTLWQGWRFVARGYATRQTPEAAQLGHLSTNLDLTPIAYALLGTPPDFMNGPMDPAFGFRLLAPYDAHEAASNWSAPLPAAADTQTLRLEARPGDSDDILDLSGTLTLQPGRRYRLTFNFRAPPQDATLQIRGVSLRREYHLPSAGGPRGFGMVAENNRALTLWTDQAIPEEMGFRLVGPGLARSPWRGRPFADVRVEPVSPAHLPVELLSLVPLRARVTAAAAGYLETPRMFLPGYEATVDGQSVRVQGSPERRAMVPVPAGESHVEMRYVGSVWLHVSFWLTCLAWMGAGAWGLVRLGPAAWRQAMVSRLAGGWAGAATAIKRTPWWTWTALAASILVLAGSAVAWQSWRETRAAVGPIRIRFVLPRGETSRQQPLLVTGQPHAGTFVYVVYHDSEHVRLGVDVWGLLGYQTEPIRTDYFAEHEVVIEAGSLYPERHRQIENLPPEIRQQLKNRLRVAFDGATVIEREITTYESTPGQMTVGHNQIGSSSCEPRFAGEILSVERLPLPAR